jgi:hypothetical protein
LRFARNIILVENNQFRTSQLPEAPERYKSVATEKNSLNRTSVEKPKIIKFLAESYAEK